MMYLDKHGKVDPSRIPDSAWEPFEYSPDGLWRKDRAWIKKPHGNEDGLSIVRKVFLKEADLLEMNRDQYDTPQRFSKKGSLDAKVASVPLNVFYKDLAQNLHDSDYIKWWLNNPENRPYRTIKGKI